jgi:hypothetical protein
MASISGQQNKYHFNFLYETSATPLSSITIHTNRSIVAKNYMVLDFWDAFKQPERLSEVKVYAETIQNLGAQFIQSRSGKVVNGKTIYGPLHPKHIEVPKYTDVRSVIEHLFTHHEIDASAKADLEPVLRELEKSAHIAASRKETISKAQKEIVESMVILHVDDIKSEAPDSETAKAWIRHVSKILSIGPGGAPLPIARESLYSALSNKFNLERKSDTFYDALFAVVRVYANMAELEGALQQSGSDLPSVTLIRETIEALFDNATPVVEEIAPRVEIPHDAEAIQNRPVTRSLTEASRHRPITRSMVKTSRFCPYPAKK